MSKTAKKPKKAIRHLHKATEPLRERFGDKKVNRFLMAVEAANPSDETIMKLAGEAGDLLKLEPSQQMITDVTLLVDKKYAEGLDRVIAKVSITKIAIALMKRNEEFVLSLLDTYKTLSDISPLLFMSALGNQPFRELLFFSYKGLADWVEDGKKRFTSESGTNISEFLRYVTMCKGYEDVGAYKISESAVFLEEIHQALTIFAQQKFNRRLVAAKSRTHVPHVQEKDEISIYLPDHIDDYEEKTRNEKEYFMDTLHEGSHIEKGSFVLEIVDIAQFLRERGVVVKKIEYRGENDKRIKMLIVDKDGKEYLATSMFHLLPLLGRSGHTPFIKALNNIFEDLRIDSGWVEEKAPGYLEDYRECVLHYLRKRRKLPVKTTASMILEGMCHVCALLPASEDKPAFLKALKEHALPEGDDRKAVEHLLSMNSEVLELVLEFEDQLLELTRAREKNSTRSFVKTFEVYEKVRHLFENKIPYDVDEKEISGMSGPLSLSDLDPENVELSLDPGKGISIDELPEEIRNKLKKRLGEAFPEMSEKDREKLAEQAAERTKKEEKQEAAPSMEITGRWNIELVDGIEVRDYCDIKTIDLAPGTFMGDEVVSLNIRNIAKRLMRRKIIEVSGGLYGEIDLVEKMEWRRMRRRGIVIPRNYHVDEEEAYARSVSILVIGDASGSTGSMLNGKRKIDYITASVHSLASGLEGIPGIKSSYGFFNSDGRNDVRFYPGKDFDKPLIFGSTKPADANRDGAIIRKAGEMLSRCNTEAKLVLFVFDSMPNDDSKYGGRYAVEDVRHALNELRNAGIQFYGITVPPDESYYKEQFRSMKDYLDYLYLAPKNYSVIQSEKELDRAFAECVKTVLPRLRRRRRI